MSSGQLSTDDKKAIREELHRVLSSPCFRNSAKCREFLRFVVERTLAGESDALKERTIAVELFGKSHDADLDRDSTVRVCARNTRKRLAEYYATGAGGPFRIELPVGSYVPVFRRTQEEGGNEAALAAGTVGAPPRRRLDRKTILAGAALIMSAVAIALLSLRTPTDLLARFWEPVLRAPGGVEVLIAAPLGGSSNSSPGAGPASLTLRSPGVSQTAAVAEILHLLRSRGARAQIGDYRRIRDEEIPDKAVVIVGATAFRGPHSWMEGCPILLRLDDNPPRFASETGEQWMAAASPDNADYAAIYRIPAEKPRPFILLIAGLNARASEIAASHLVDPGRLESLLRAAPAGWEKARMVVLLEIRRRSVRPVSVLLW